MNHSGAVLIDTDVCSLVFVATRPTDARAAAWRRLLLGRQVIVSFQTRAELLAGALANNWGHHQILKLHNIIDRIPAIVADDSVIATYAKFYADCRRSGHALHDKKHTGDRWIAACAIAYGLELLAGDKIYANAPGLSLVRE